MTVHSNYRITKNTTDGTITVRNGEIIVMIVTIEEWTYLISHPEVTDKKGR